MRPPVFVTFKVTTEGVEGSPMDHVLTTIQIDDDGAPVPESMTTLESRLRREIARKVAAQ